MASKRRLRRNACEGKRNYATQADAVAASESLRRRTGERTNVYRCQFCSGWHHGHLPQIARRAMKARRGF